MHLYSKFVSKSIRRNTTTFLIRYLQKLIVNNYSFNIAVRNVSVDRRDGTYDTVFPGPTDLAIYDRAHPASLSWDICKNRIKT